MPDDDLRLLQDCLADKPGAWEALVNRFTPLIAGICRHTLRRCGQPSGSQEVADMVQETLAELLKQDRRALRAYKGKAPVSSYLGILAVYRVLGTRPPLRQVPGSLPEPVDPAPAPWQGLESQELRDQVARQLSRLTPQEQLALTLRQEGATLKEVGSALGISEDAAARLLAKAKALLRIRLPAP